MKKSGLLSAISPRLIVASMLLCTAPVLAGDYTTLSINSVPANGPVVLTNSLTIDSNQVAQIVALPIGILGWYFLDIEIKGHTYTFPPWAELYNWRETTPVAGPATIRLRSGPTNQNAVVTTYCTVRVTPESFRPDKTVMVTPGSGGANVSLESSTNLSEWAAVTNGIHPAIDAARFFRINLNRVGFIPPVPADGSVASQTDAQTTTLCVKTTNGSNGRDELTINQYQTAEIVAVNMRSATLELWRGGNKFLLPFSEQTRTWRDSSPVRGPATFKLDGAEGYCTIRVFTEQYPPDKTLITLPGTNSYAVTLEGSTDLVNWAAATNGTYTVAQAMFFRIRSDLVTPLF